MRKGLQYASAILLTLSLGVSCSKDKSPGGDPSSDLDRKPMLEHYVNDFITPGYNTMVSTLETLKNDITAFTANPADASLKAARYSFDDAYLVWQNVDMLDFGPADDESLRSFVNIYPVTVSKVNNNISSGSYELEEFGNKDAQGFPAVDYLLNGIGSTDAAVIDMYTTDAQAAARKQYLLDVVNKMLEKVTKVRDQWGTYKNTFINSTGTDANSSLSLMVNGFVMYYERYFRSGKIGLPVGAMTGVAKPELTEAYYRPELSKQLAYESIVAVKRFYDGYDIDGNAIGEGMYSYLKALGTTDDNGASMAEVISSELNSAVYEVNNIPTTIKSDVVNNRSQMLEVYEQLQKVVPLLKVDMVSAFSISISYTDNDGD